jgi:flagellar basal body-associated protein FliL
MKQNKKKDNNNMKKDKTPNTKKERVEKSYFSVTRKRRNKQLMIIVPAVLVLIAIMAYAVTVYSENLQKPNLKFGPLGSEHVHAAFAVKINGEKLNFSQPQYQVRSKYIHVENNDGNTLHRHATRVPVGEFFRSVGMNVTNNCFTLENKTSYCSNGTSNLEFYVNGNKTNSIANYVLKDNDRILIVYGNKNEMETQQDLDALRLTKIKK